MKFDTTARCRPDALPSYNDVSSRRTREPAARTPAGMRAARDGLRILRASKRRGLRAALAAGCHASGVTIPSHYRITITLQYYDL
ncbi:hypothetical protein EVAR_75373_1 [Eumeta japonica]|uniref:Uncharacterized protein n=1 Tax=Eumeta variegata TaxID=151549 RepID=A0A4C1YCQ9_EUMVA|nr:hypothetical protein EVAR_75373_1 [Eumeta japonica]